MRFKTLFFLILVAIFASCKSAKTYSKPVAKTKNVSTQEKTAITKIAKQKTSEKTEELEELEATSKIAVTKDNVQLYIENFQEIAKNNMKVHGIPASITLAQGILESGAGKGKLAILANNHFGIKCHKGWTGESMKHDDDSSQECFRKYKDPADSYRDHSFFLTSRSWYKPLFKLDKGDYVAWAKGLKAAGYATDPKYPEKLIGIIQRYKLNKYDEEVLNRITIAENKIIPENTENTYTIQQGDTLYSLSKKLNLTVEEIKDKNNLKTNNLTIGQKIKIK